MFFAALQDRGLRRRWAGTAGNGTTARAETEEHREVWRKGWRSWRGCVHSRSYHHDAI